MSEKAKKKKEKTKQKGDLHSLLIVGNKTGDLFLVEDKKKADKSLKKLKKLEKKKEKRLKKLLKKAQKLVEIQLKNKVKKEPPEPVPDDENPYVSYGTANDIFILDTIKSEPVEAPIPKPSSQVPVEKDEEQFEIVENSSQLPPVSDDDDDFTWHQDEDHDFRYGLNNTHTVRKDPKPVETPKTKEVKKSVRIKQKPVTEIKTEPDIYIKKESDSDFSVASDFDDDNLDADFDEEVLEEETKPVSSKPRKNKKAEDCAYIVKKTPSEDAKKKKLTGKKACKFCATIWKTQKEVEKHKCEFLQCKPNQFICRICHKTLARSAFSRHMSYVHGDAKFQCDICSKQFKDRRKLVSHITTHTGDRAFKCEVEGCSASFTNNYGLMRHMGTHGITPPSFKCQFCEKEFAYAYNLKNHEAKVHTQDFQYYCDYCMKGFVRKNQLIPHIQSRHLQLRLYRCSVCNFSFTLKKYLDRHFKGKHMPNVRKSYPCNICKKELSTPQNLRQHQMLHTGERHHVCDQCGNSFITVKSLKAHRCADPNAVDADGKKKKPRIGRNKDYYIEKYCRYCDVSFDTWAERDMHQCPYLVNSTDPKSYICRICEKQIRRSKFNSHANVHTTGKVTCDVCPRSFVNMSRLLSHKKRIHEHPELFRKKSTKKKDAMLGENIREVTVIQYFQDSPQQAPIYYGNMG